MTKFAQIYSHVDCGAVSKSCFNSFGGLSYNDSRRRVLI